jgi:ornithine cyclodeaminase
LLYNCRLDVRLLREAEIRGLIGPAEALTEVRKGFVKLARGEVDLPSVLDFDIKEHRGESHVKGAYIHGSPFFSVKEAAGFYGNSERGLSVTSGLTLVFDATTGFPGAILLDNGYLTELRTGAAGALAADTLAKADVRRVAVIGSGGQARYQLEALLQVRRPQNVVVYGRTAERAQDYAREMQSRFDLPVEPVGTVREAVEDSDLVITTTPSREPIIAAEWISPGTHLTAVGADLAEKQELDVQVLARADKVVADRIDQCVRQGELHHAVEAGVMKREDVYAELGEIAAGQKLGRERDDELTVADLTGLGVQDAAVANYVAIRAREFGAGEALVL